MTVRGVFTDLLYCVGKIFIYLCISMSVNIFSGFTTLCLVYFKVPCTLLLVFNDLHRPLFGTVVSDDSSIGLVTTTGTLPTEEGSISVLCDCPFYSPSSILFLTSSKNNDDIV